MFNASFIVRLLVAFAALLLASTVSAQSFKVQCPTTTTKHPNADGTADDASSIKCQQISGGDGFVTMGDGAQVYLFGFGPLSGLKDIRRALPGTQPPAVFNTPLPDKYLNPFLAGSGPSSLIGMPDATFDFNGAIGITADQLVDIPAGTGATATATLIASGGALGNVLDTITIQNGGSGYLSAPNVTIGQNPAGNSQARATAVVDLVVGSKTYGQVVSITIQNVGNGYATAPAITIDLPAGLCSKSNPSVDSKCITGAVDPRMVMDVGVMNATEPAPMIAIDEDDELFLTLTNVGMIMRPDLFEQHTVHFHGYPNASSFYDGVPDASVAINIGGSFTYYYLAPDAGTYFWHCHISPPEHLQMGMVGQLYVRPRQNRVLSGASLYASLYAYETATLPAKPAYKDYEPLRKRCGGDILCSSPLPAGGDKGATGGGTYAYNDGDGSTRYDVEYPLQMMSFDPNFHFVGMTFNPEAFADMKDKYFMLNGRSYPDTVQTGAMQTQSTDGTAHSSQPLPSIINIPAGGRALLRISDLNVSEYHTLASLGIPMRVIALNARLLRDLAGNDMTYLTNSITLGGGESLDVLLDATGYEVGQKFYLYTPNLDRLSNDAENFGGMMTEVNICKTVDPMTKVCGS
jgi:FtsP/CotA-like multicopper oxidase with cupredoxin domain